MIASYVNFIFDAVRQGGIMPKATAPKYRSAVTGRYVTPKYAKTHPKTTVKESK